MRGRPTQRSALPRAPATSIANPLASPALVSLDVLGTPTAHVAVGTTDGQLQRFRASDLFEGARSTSSSRSGSDPDDPFIDVDDVMTPSVPVQPSGVTPGPGSLVGEAQFVYVAASGEFPFFPASSTGIDDTIAYKLHVNGGAFESSTSSCRSRTPTPPRGSR